MIILRSMKSDEFQKHIVTLIEGYAKDKVLAGNWSEEESLDRAKAELANLLPDGEKTENNYLYSILNDNQVIGMIWLAQTGDEEGFIYEISIDEQFQGYGFGKEAMKRLEEVAKDLGMKKIGLHVFGHNHRAISLYEKLDYIPTNIIMAKEL